MMSTGFGELGNTNRLAETMQFLLDAALAGRVIGCNVDVSVVGSEVLTYKLTVQIKHPKDNLSDLAELMRECQRQELAERIKIAAGAKP